MRSTAPSVRKVWTILIKVALVLAVGAWLFGDTVRHCTSLTGSADEIRFAHFGTYQDFQTWGRVIAAFEAAHPGVHVRQEYVVGWYGHYDTKLRQQMLAGTLPEVALVQIGPFTAMADRFSELTQRVESPQAGIDLKLFHPTARQLFTFDGHVRGLPVSGGNLLIYVNPDCFERAGIARGESVPLPGSNWTMDDFRRTARALTLDFDDDGRIDQFGFWQPRWLYYLPFIWSFGGELLDDSLTEWRLTGPEAEAAFAFYQEMRVGAERYAPHPHEISQVIQDVGFLTGKVAMCVNGPWFQPFLAETKLADRYIVAPIPAGPAGRFTRVTWDGIAMAPNLSPTRADQAWAFMRFVCGEEAQGILATTQRALPARMNATSTFDRNGNDPRARRFVEALSYSRTQPRTPHFKTIDRAVCRNVRRLFDASTQSPRAFLQEVCTTVAKQPELSCDAVKN